MNDADGAGPLHDPQVRGPVARAAERTHPGYGIQRGRPAPSRKVSRMICRPSGLIE